MAIISRLAVLLGLDAGEFNANLGKAKDKVEGFSTAQKYLYLRLELLLPLPLAKQLTLPTE